MYESRRRLHTHFPLDKARRRPAAAGVQTGKAAAAAAKGEVGGGAGCCVFLACVKTANGGEGAPRCFGKGRCQISLRRREGRGVVGCVCVCLPAVVVVVGGGGRAAGRHGVAPTAARAAAC